MRRGREEATVKARPPPRQPQFGDATSPQPRKFLKKNTEPLSPISVPQALLERIKYTHIEDGTEVDDVNGFTSFREMVQLPYNFICGKKVGAGARGAVFDIEDARTYGKHVALKVIPGESVQDDINLPPESNAPQREIAAMLAVKSEFENDDDEDGGGAHFARMHYYFKMKLSDLVDFYSNPQSNFTYLSELYLQPLAEMSSPSEAYSALGRDFGYFLQRIARGVEGEEGEGEVPRSNAFAELNQVIEWMAANEGEPPQNVDTAYYFIVSELVRDDDGRGPISRTLDNTDFQSPAEAVEVIDQLGQAMLFLQQKRIIHGDLYDRNIAVQRGGGGGSSKVKIIDFGFACAYPVLGSEEVPAYSCKVPQDEWRASIAEVPDFAYAYSFTLDPFTVLLTLSRMLARQNEETRAQYESVSRFLGEEFAKAQARMKRQVDAEQAQKNRFRAFVELKLQRRYPLTASAWLRITKIVEEQIESTIIRSVQTADMLALLTQTADKLTPIIQQNVSSSDEVMQVTIALLDSVKRVLDSIVDPNSAYAKALGEDYTAQTFVDNFLLFRF